jgi:hypothetical protein
MNHILDEKQLEEMLENSVPAQTGRLEQRLAHAPWTPHAAARRRLINATVFAVLAAALFVAVTPQGHTFAQSILQFFVRTESDTRPVPTLVSVISVTGTPEYQTSHAFPETRLPFEETCGDLLHPRCSLGEIRAMVAFPVKGLQATVDGLTFEGATGGPEQVMLVYTGEHVNGGLTIAQEPASASSQQSQQVAASAAVETVSINGAAGEYVQGSWYSIDAKDGVSWTADPFVQTLRWEADSVLYSMVFRAGKDTGSKLDKDDLLYLAEQLTTGIDAHASRERLQPVEIEQISEQAGFTVIKPGWLPSEYVFLGGAYTPEQKTACLYYRYGAGDLPVLAVAERSATGSSILDDITTPTANFEGKEINIPIVTEAVEVGGAEGGQALLISNGVNTSKLCPNQDLVANQALYWQSAGKDYIIFGLIDQYQSGVFISRLEMQRLAENLTGVTTIAEDRVDPQRLQKVEEASSLAGFAVKAPTQMVAGIQFDHAVYLEGAVASDRAAGEAGKPAEVVNLIYTRVEKPTRGGIDYGLLITEVSGALRPLEEVYGWGGFEYVAINGQTGLYRKMCWDGVTGNTDCRQELYWDENGIGYGFNLYLPGALEKDEFFAIVKSMQVIHH